MSAITDVATTAVGVRLLGKSKKLRAIVASQVEQFAYSSPRAVTELRQYAWLHALVIIFLISGVVGFPFAAAYWIYTPLLNIVVGGTVVVVPNDGQYVFMIGSLLVWPFLFLVIFGVVRKLFPQLHLYLAAIDAREQLLFSGKLLRAKGAVEQHAQLQQIVSTYDVKKAAFWKWKRAVLGLVCTSILSFPLLYLGVESYIAFDEDDIRVSNIFDLSEKRYAWDAVQSSDLVIETEEGQDGERHRTPKLLLRFTDNSVVDLWQFGILQRTAKDVIPLCEELNAHDIQITQHPLPDISTLRESVQSDIHCVFDNPACGAVSICKTVSTGSALWQLLECQ